MSSTITALTSGGGLAMAGDTSGQLEFKTNNGTTAMTITTGQKVGIGSTSPSANLYVTGAGSGTFSPYNDPVNVKGTDYSLLYVNGTNGIAASVYSYNSSNGWYTGTNNSASYRIGYMSTIDGTGITNAKDGSTGITIDTSGNVQIGTTNSALNSGTGIKFNYISAGSQIAVVGSDSTASYNTYFLYSTGAGANRFYVGFNGQIYATNTSISGISDISLKENIKDLETGLDTVMALKPRRFDWKNGDATNVAGFVAQEVEEVLPELVTEYQYNETETKKALKMGDMLPTLVKAIQELNAKVEAQALEIKALKGVA